MDYEPHSCNASEQILKWPDGSIEKEVLENLLDYCEGLDKNELVIITRHRRVKGFDWDTNQKWENVERRVKIDTLHKIYESEYGRPFQPSDPDKNKYML